MTEFREERAKFTAESPARGGKQWSHGCQKKPLPWEEGGKGSCPGMRVFHHTETHLQKILLLPIPQSQKQNDNSAKRAQENEMAWNPLMRQKQALHRFPCPCSPVLSSSSSAPWLLAYLWEEYSRQSGSELLSVSGLLDAALFYVGTSLNPPQPEGAPVVRLTAQTRTPCSKQQFQRPGSQPLHSNTMP